MTANILTKSDKKVIKNFNLDRFYSDSVGAFVFDVNEAIEYGRLGHAFYTKLYKAFTALNNTRYKWVIETVDDDCELYIIYKTVA